MKIYILFYYSQFQNKVSGGSVVLSEGRLERTWVKWKKGVAKCKRRRSRGVGKRDVAGGQPTISVRGLFDWQIIKLKWTRKVVWLSRSWTLWRSKWSSWPRSWVSRKRRMNSCERRIISSPKTAPKWKSRFSKCVNRRLFQSSNMSHGKRKLRSRALGRRKSQTRSRRKKRRKTKNKQDLWKRV